MFQHPLKKETVLKNIKNVLGIHLLSAPFVFHRCLSKATNQNVHMQHPMDQKVSFRFTVAGPSELPGRTLCVPRAVLITISFSPRSTEWPPACTQLTSGTAVALVGNGPAPSGDVSSMTRVVSRTGCLNGVEPSGETEIRIAARQACAERREGQNRLT